MAEKVKSVMVGMSGGVDSTVTALLLQQQGYEVVGVTFRLWSPAPEEGLEESGCCSFDDVRDAKMVCTSLGIPHYVFNYKEKFRQEVVDPFANAYANGRTPNPCVDCNRTIKFSDFLHRAKGMGYDYIATGHYARVEQSPETGLFHLREGISTTKDQSYFLYNLTQKQLSSILMPLGEYDKPAVRQIAAEHGFAASTKPDSQDICFIADGDYASFLDQYTGQPSIPGDFIDQSGNLLGKHQGIRHYTVGQRKGLGIAFGTPMFVQKILPETNQVILGEEESLYTTTLIANKLSWTAFDQLETPLETTARIRYNATPAKVLITPQGDKSVHLTFQDPQRAATPGQSVVFYQGDQVLGGGVIDQVL